MIDICILLFVICLVKKPSRESTKNLAIPSTPMNTGLVMIETIAIMLSILIGEKHFLNILKS